ncbi:hypothetical protein ABH941_004861 [Streptacidiphilus sp. EB103A]
MVRRPPEDREVGRGELGARVGAEGVGEGVGEGLAGISERGEGFRLLPAAVPGPYQRVERDRGPLGVPRRSLRPQRMRASPYYVLSRPKGPQLHDDERFQLSEG